MPFELCFVLMAMSLICAVYGEAKRPEFCNTQNYNVTDMQQKKFDCGIQIYKDGKMLEIAKKCYVGNMSDYYESAEKRQKYQCFKKHDDLLTFVECVDKIAKEMKVNVSLLHAEVKKQCAKFDS